MNDSNINSFSTFPCMVVYLGKKFRILLKCKETLIRDLVGKAKMGLD